MDYSPNTGAAHVVQSTILNSFGFLLGARFLGGHSCLCGVCAMLSSFWLIGVHGMVQKAAPCQC